jgi:hypothetical protein
MIGVNNHEGINGTIILTKKGKLKLSESKIRIEAPELNSVIFDLKITDNDTILRIILPKNSGMSSDNSILRKISNRPPSDPDASLQSVLVNSLFKGEYILVNKGDNNQKVIIASDGKISGLDNFKSLSVQSDYFGGDFNDDMLDLYDEKGEAQTLVFEIQDNEIFLYKTVLNSEEFPVKDKLLYRLKRL